VKESCDTPIWARSKQTRRSTLTREAIVEAAVRIADAEGLSAVSIRRVATELDARTMSLYTYIDTKDDLLDLMGNEAAAEILIEDDALPADWREAISMIARREIAVTARHPWMVELIGGRRRHGPNALRHVEQSIKALSGLDADPDGQWRVLVAVDDYVLGYVVRAARERARPESSGRAVLDQEVWVQELVKDGGLPHLGRILADKNVGRADTFEQGLAWMLDGIAAEFEK
jgi:AcrR family transcriptional regulator